MIEVGDLHRLSDEQRTAWDRDGYIVLRAALSAVERDRLATAIARLPDAAGPTGVVNAFDVIERDAAFVDLMDHRALLGIACDLIGPHLQLLMSQVMVRPPTADAPLAWHHDGPKPYHFPSVGGVVPLLNLKIGWFLTDALGPNTGNLLVVPGSHCGGLGLSSVSGELEQSARETAELRTDLAGAVELHLAAGDAVIFHNALWHAVAPHHGAGPRIVCYYAYGPPWLRLQDRTAPSAELVARCGPVRRQLIGALAAPEDHGGMHSADSVAPLVDLFDKRSRAEIMRSQIHAELQAPRR